MRRLEDKIKLLIMYKNHAGNIDAVPYSAGQAATGYSLAKGLFYHAPQVRIVDLEASEDRTFNSRTELDQYLSGKRTERYLETGL